MDSNSLAKILNSILNTYTPPCTTYGAIIFITKNVHFVEKKKFKNIFFVKSQPSFSDFLTLTIFFNGMQESCLKDDYVNEK